jgi:hypothetical protein
VVPVRGGPTKRKSGNRATSGLRDLSFAINSGSSVCQTPGAGAKHFFGGCARSPAGWRGNHSAFRSILEPAGR